MTKTIGILDHGSGQLHSEKSHTCDRCLAAWSKVPFDEKSADICEIEEKAEELLTSACQVCQMLGMEMLVHQTQTHSLEGPFLLRWQRENQDFGAAVLQDSNGIIRGESSQPRTIQIRYSESSESSEAYGLEEHETVEGLHVDFGTIRSWLDKCDSHHQCKSDIDEEPQNLKVIDCVERVVVPAPLDCQYVALSYVWGGLVVKIDSISGLLPTMLPRTIEDSIKATLLLGYRYLWVDAFCIKQDDAEDKHCQIQQMDLIYTSAVLTLVAAAGSNPSYGLPGVSNARRLSYRVTCIGDVRVFFAPDEVYRAVADSVWFTRGWTFQEGYVPRRRLYFTESGVLFICNEAEEQERFHRCRDPWGARLLDGTLGTRPFGVTDDELSGLHGTLRLLEKYMERQLSYENDALDAMLGVLNYHHARNPSIGTICGLPYQASVAGPDTLCLNWIHDRPATRRRGYPSWSPLGWNGPVQFWSPDHQFFPSKKDAAVLSRHFRDGSAAWNNLKTSKYLQITVNVHNLPIVNLVRSDSEDFEGMLSEHPRTVLVVPAGTRVKGKKRRLLRASLTRASLFSRQPRARETKADYRGLNYYMDINWDATPPDHYDSTWVTCVVYHSHEDVQCLMIVQDCGTHYGRLGFASAAGIFYTDTMKAAGFEELASTTNGLPTLRPRESPNFYREHSHDSKDFDWLQDTEKVTITLG